MKKPWYIRYALWTLIGAVLGVVGALTTDHSWLAGLPLGIFLGLAVSLTWDLVTKGAAGHLDDIDSFKSDEDTEVEFGGRIDARDNDSNGPTA